jgi:hypothetical protein
MHLNEISVFSREKLTANLLQLHNNEFLPSKKTWVEKINDSKGLPKVEKITDKMRKRWGTGKAVIPAPIEVDAMMRKVPAGKLVTINEICATLARKHKATISCPMTTGIFAWVAANAAEEREKSGERYRALLANVENWRFLNENYSGGAEAQTLSLEREGPKIIKNGKNTLYSTTKYR